jgi:hypothetical protein
MPDRGKASEREWHRRQGVELFNGTWKLLEKRRRTRAEDLRMVHMAHASRYHWGVVGTPANVAVGEWQVSHVYAILGRAEPARYHARASLEICRANKVGDWQLAFAYEALARADAVAGLAQDLRTHLVAARRAGRRIRDLEDREEFFRQLGTIRRRRSTG